jgi:hypothetical protein
MPFNVNAFQGDQNIVEYWIPDTRTYNYSGLGSSNNSGTQLPGSLSQINSRLSSCVEKIIVGIVFRQ